MLDQAALLFVILDTFLITPIATPPVTPSVLACSTAVSTCVSTFFTCSGAFGTGAEAAAAVSDYGDKTAAAEDAEDDFDGDDEGRAWWRHTRASMMGGVALLRCRRCRRGG